MKRIAIVCLVLVLNMGIGMAQEKHKENKEPKVKTQMQVKIIKEIDGVRTEIDTTFVTDGSEESLFWLKEMKGSDIDMNEFTKNVQEMHNEKIEYHEAHPDLDHQEANEFVFEKHIEIECDQEGKADHDCANHLIIEIDSDVEHMEVISNDGEHVKVKRIVIEADEVEGAEKLREIKLQISEDGEINADDMEKIMQIEVDIDEEQHGDVSVKKTMVFITRVSQEDADQLPEDKQAEFTPKEGEQLNLSYMSFYPNPNDGRFNLSFSSPEEGHLKIQIIDVEGKEVYKEKLKNFSGNYDKQIDLSDRPAGVYFMRVEQNGKSVAKKIAIK